MKNMHIPLSEEVYAVLLAHAKATGESVTALARGAIERLAKEIERERIRSEIAAFAAEYAGTEWDLDPELEEAGLEVLRANP
ncbi:hypothetical protein SAMN04488058_108102 [Deinococcus reticulitermitis]|uniref:Ribbon-helix-helix protein, copG family n=1 Tax=Deinococcus reticulitermitis TaxID=856736 RepID=A0A1H6YZY3_9DEIO|nr:hypothetical protein [Deinococcus reticulitermitis]SEJ45364.1 hypothetical protein SAMN04488058_108102 [Deinococcus reticulitermitis]